MPAARPQFVIAEPDAPVPVYAHGKPFSASVTSHVTPTAADIAILRAVLYASIFDFPLSLEELRRVLASPVGSVEELRATLSRSLFLRSRIERVGDWVVPADRSDLCERRKVRDAHSRRFLQRHRRLLDVVCALPFTRLVAISGSLAHLNADERADLDLFILTRGPHVWTVTLLLVLVAKLLRRRDVLCANFVLADSHQVLDQHDVYTASQVVHLQPVIGAEAYAAFVDANPFVFRWFPNAKESRREPFPLPRAGGLRRLKRPLEILLTLPGGAIEWVCRRAYGWHLRRSVSRWKSPDQVRLDRCCLKLHTNSHRTMVLRQFEQLVSDALAPTAADRRPDDVC